MDDYCDDLPDVPSNLYQLDMVKFKRDWERQIKRVQAKIGRLENRKRKIQEELKEVKLELKDLTWELKVFGR